MKKIIAIMLLLTVGCTQYKRLTGQEHEGSGIDSGTHTVASVGTLPASHTLTFTPTLDRSETLLSVEVRISGVLTTISDTPSIGVYFTFDKPSGVLTINNYTGGDFAVYYQSPYAAGFHSLN